QAGKLRRTPRQESPEQVQNRTELFAERLFFGNHTAIGCRTASSASQLKRVCPGHSVPPLDVNNLRSCSFRPSSSSAAKFRMSFCSPKARNTLKYAPNATLGSPFSIRYKVDLAISARSETWAVVSFRRRLVNFICSPFCPKSCLCFGKMICFLLRISSC